MFYAIILTHPDSDGRGIIVCKTAKQRERRTRRMVYDHPKDADKFVRKLMSGKAHRSPTDPDTAFQWLDVNGIEFHAID